MPSCPPGQPGMIGVRAAGGKGKQREARLAAEPPAGGRAGSAVEQHKGAAADDFLLTAPNSSHARARTRRTTFSSARTARRPRTDTALAPPSESTATCLAAAGSAHR